MEAFVISMFILLSIFIIVSIVVLIRRKQKAKKGLGYVINEAPVSHGPPGGIPVTHYPPPNYQAHVYPVTYSYPGQNISQVQVQVPMQMQGMPAQMNGMQATYPPMQQRAFNDGTMSNAGLTVVPVNFEKQIHQGAVETVSQI